MREIKFQAWLGHTMVQVVKMDFMKDSNGEYCAPWQGYFLDGENKGVHTGFRMSDASIRQYTGVKDKNDTEIYEGDIVHFIRPDLPYVIRGNGYFDTEIEEGFQLKGEVKFLYGCWFIDEGEGKGCPLEFEKEQILEVIGNVYQK